MNYLQVKVTNPLKTLFEGKALAISSKNSQGKFDILPDHANFITLVEKNPITISREDKQTIKLEVNQAIIHNFKNQVTIYIDPQTTLSSS